MKPFRLAAARLRPAAPRPRWRLRAAFLSLAAAVSAGGPTPAVAVDIQLAARFDWRSDGEIRQVWLHREFDGRLTQTAPLQIEAAPQLLALLDGATIDCVANTKVGLPDWSVTTGTCTLSRPGATVVIEIVECAGTQALCEGEWRIVSAAGTLVGLTGGGTLRGHIVDPSPLPWFYNGPVLGYNELWGTVAIP